MDVRIIAATNKNLPAAVREGKFRADLFYRLAQYAPVLKPIREYSPAQKEELLDNLLRKINNEKYFSQPRTLASDAKKILLNHPWDGNIREMKFRLESICLLSDVTITAEDVSEQLAHGMINSSLPQTVSHNYDASLVSLPEPDMYAEHDIPHDLRKWLDEWESFWIRKALTDSPNIAKAAARLGLKKSTFFSRKTKLGL